MKTSTATRTLRSLGACALLCLAAWLVPASAAFAEDGPGWTLTAVPYPTNFAPEASGNLGGGPGFHLVATNVGGGPTTAPFTITDTLPAGLSLGEGPIGSYSEVPLVCSSSVSGGRTTVECVGGGPQNTGGPLKAGVKAILDIAVNVEPGVGPSLLNEATVSGGGAPEAASTTAPVKISTETPSFGFTEGPAGAFGGQSRTDGSVATLAGSHPFLYTPTGFSLPIAGVEGLFIASEGGVRDVVGELPRGMVFNPSVSAARCTEAELEFNDVFNGNHCPAASQVGVATTTITLAGPNSLRQPIYNMVTPAGAAAEFAFDPIGLPGVYIHVIGHVRTESDYGLNGESNDILSRVLNPLLGAELTFWGDPTGNRVQDVRTPCLQNNEFPHCPLPESERSGESFLTLPSDCSGTPLNNNIRMSNWLHPEQIFERSFESADSNGNPVSIDGCNQLDFEPSIESRATTNLTDSPSGLDFKLHQPQENQFEGRSTANLRDATVTLPEGLTLNPSAADGLAGCSPAQIGLKTAVGDENAHFTDDAPACPSGAKIGTVEVKTPPLEETLQGSVYLAQPYQNPFKSLVSTYFTIESPRYGLQVKLAGKVSLDPATGRLTTTLKENPEQPIEDFNVHFFTGARAAFRTPSACGTYQTTTDMVPWTSPEGADAYPNDAFSTLASPAGGACPTSASGQPSSPGFSAGTISPVAGAYSPFVLKLSRGDGTQPLGGFDTTLPEGLTGKLAGIPYCSEADIAKAKSREAPNMGAEEIASPSCPAASEVGTVDAAAGAGPTPYNTTGHAYLAGPYEGAPLSLVTIVPAVAGPFDLGAVVVRAAMHVDPETARIHAVSDPFPQIIDGIPLDLRSVSVKLGRPDFTLNPTSCDPKNIGAGVSSAFGSVSSLTVPFQVGGCPALGFKPSLKLHLSSGRRTSFPALRAVFTPRAGDANLNGLVLTLPRTEFIEQAHFKTICTRVQFAAGAGNGAQCPPRSVYGQARIFTPLLDRPLEGPVFLRSSTHKLPDAVFAVNGQINAAIPVHVDSVGGRLRATIEGAPDVPVSKAIVKMQGGKKGLFVNSANLCGAKKPKASVLSTGQNGKASDFDLNVQVSCAGRHHRKG